MVTALSVTEKTFQFTRRQWNYCFVSSFYLVLLQHYQVRIVSFCDLIMQVKKKFKSLKNGTSQETQVMHNLN